MKKINLFSFFILQTLFCFAQIDTLSLPQAEIASERLHNFGFTQKVLIDSLDRSQTENLAEVLTQKTGIYFKTYGQGSLASPSSRGTGFGHLSVIWNGFNLQHPMLGGLDFSLISASIFDAIELQQNGASSIFGSGTIGGAILLNNTLKYSKGISIKTGIGMGSFGEEEIYTQAAYSNAKMAIDIAAFGTELDNDFEFINNRGEKDTLGFAALQTASIAQNTQFKIGNRHQLKSSIWLNRADRQIPPSETAANSNATQLDESQRFGLEWKSIYTKTVFKSRVAYLREHILFQSDLIAPSDSRTQNFIAEAEIDQVLAEKWKLNIGLHQNLAQADASVFAEIEKRQEFAAFSALQYSLVKDRSVFIVSARQAMLNQNSIPLVWSFLADQKISKGLKMQLSVSKNYNLPTFNDLYWPESGNPNLLPESGLNSELSFLFTQQNKSWNFDAKASFYQNNIDDWILWSPNNIGLWTPNNQRKVQTQGVELFANLKRNTRYFQWSWSGVYTFTQATVKEVYTGSASSLDKQLIFVPQHQLKNTIRYSIWNFSLQYHHFFTSKVYTTSDNNKELPAYQIGDFQIHFQQDFAKFNCLFYFKINNLWNADYETVPFRPMPLRHYKIGVELKI